MEKLIKHSGYGPQEELLDRYCSEIDSRVLKASNAAEAKRIADQVCDQFRQKCDSSILIHATRVYADEMISRTWGTEFQGTGHPPDEH